MKDVLEIVWSPDSLTYVFGAMKAVSMYMVDFTWTLDGWTGIPWLTFLPMLDGLGQMSGTTGGVLSTRDIRQEVEQICQRILEHASAFRRASREDDIVPESGVTLLYHHLFNDLRSLGEMADLILTGFLRGMTVDTQRYDRILLERTRSSPPHGVPVALSRS